MFLTVFSIRTHLEHSMPISESLIPEFDQEVANTRHVLERVPTEQFGWRPHEKSWSMGDLATHIAGLPSWVKYTFTTEELDIAPADGQKIQQPKCSSTAEVLNLLGHSTEEARQAILALPDSGFMQPWTLKARGKALMTLPRIAVYRGTIMNHLIHHRGQLTLYLRLCGVPLPNIYGPTADEPGMF
jgi:uncharacterized damage-inducible protein DinB